MMQISAKDPNLHLALETVAREDDYLDLEFLLFPD